MTACLVSKQGYIVSSQVASTQRALAWQLHACLLLFGTTIFWASFCELFFIRPYKRFPAVISKPTLELPKQPQGYLLEASLWQTAAQAACLHCWVSFHTSLPLSWIAQWKGLLLWLVASCKWVSDTWWRLGRLCWPKGIQGGHNCPPLSQ